MTVDDEANKKNQFSRTKEDLLRWRMVESDGIHTMLRNMNKVAFVQSTDPAEDANRTAFKIWDIEISEYLKGRKRYKGQKG